MCVCVCGCRLFFGKVLSDEKTNKKTYTRCLHQHANFWQQTAFKAWLKKKKSGVLSVLPANASKFGPTGSVDDFPLSSAAVHTASPQGCSHTEGA